jgi:hypothetical protein
MNKYQYEALKRVMNYELPQGEVEEMSIATFTKAGCEYVSVELKAKANVLIPCILNITIEPLGRATFRAMDDTPCQGTVEEAMEFGWHLNSEQPEVDKLEAFWREAHCND